MTSTDVYKCLVSFTLFFTVFLHVEWILGMVETKGVVFCFLGFRFFFSDGHMVSLGMFRSACTGRSSGSGRGSWFECLLCFILRPTQG